MHPEYVQPLRDEITKFSENHHFDDQNGELPLLDSFLKETARLNPLNTSQLSLLRAKFDIV